MVDKGRTILLGAGASVEAGVPAARQMAQSVYAALGSRRGRDTQALDIAIAGLCVHQCVSRHDPFGEIDIEDLYEALLLLAKRDKHLLAPFVGTWSHTLLPSDRPELREPIGKFVKELAEGIRAASSGHGLGNELTLEQALLELISLATDDRARIFLEAAKLVREEVCRFCRIRSPEKVRYLMPLIVSSKRSPLWIASLNYDDTIEVSASVLGVPVDLGLCGATIGFNADSRLCLAKLHGSTDWWRNIQGEYERHEGYGYDPLMIFGSGNKLRVDGPYLDLLFAFRSRLEETESLYVCGYSFRDPHVNHLLLSWLRAKRMRRIQVVNPGLEVVPLLESIDRSLQISHQQSSWDVSKQISVLPLHVGEWIAQTFETDSIHDRPSGATEAT